MFPSSSPPLERPFASATDITIHRRAWRSPRAIDYTSRRSPRKLPSRCSGTSYTPPVPFANDEDSPPMDELQWRQHRWLAAHGKPSDLKTVREQETLLKRWFESLDADGSGEVGVAELEDPLVSVGLARNREDVRELVERVDRDGSGEITFDEFLAVMSPPRAARRSRAPLHAPKHLAAAPTSAYSDDGPQDNPVLKLFHDLQAGRLGDVAIPFPVLITAYRRRMLLNAHMAEDPAARGLGASVLRALESSRRASTQPGSPRRGSVVSVSGRSRSLSHGDGNVMRLPAL